MGGDHVVWSPGAAGACRLSILVPSHSSLKLEENQVLFEADNLEFLTGTSTLLTVSSRGKGYS